VLRRRPEPLVRLVDGVLRGRCLPEFPAFRGCRTLSNHGQGAAVLDFDNLCGKARLSVARRVKTTHNARDQGKRPLAHAEADVVGRG